MNCEEVRELLDPLFDNELPQHEAVAVKEHLNDCVDCQSEYENIAELHDSLLPIGRFRAPDMLTNKLNEQVKSLNDQRIGNQKKHVHLLSMMTHSTAAIFGGAIVFMLLSIPSGFVNHSDYIVIKHVDSLVNDSLIQVKSSDKHKVKPWFTGKIDFAPVVKNLEAEGFFLEGGRVEKFNDRNIAVLVYKRREHIVNLFIDLGLYHKEQINSVWNRNGYHVVSAEQGDFIYWAVSDVNVSELQMFLSLIIKA